MLTKILPWWRLRLWVSAFALLLISLSGRAALPIAVDGEALPSLAPMLKRVMPAVVNISTRGEVAVREHPLLSDPFFRRFFKIPEQRRKRDTQSLGSGVIVDAQNGYVVTNHHVIEHAQEITVTLIDGRGLNAKLVGTDPDTDIAVIQVPPENLTEIQATNSDALRVGDFVVAIGNPFGLSHSVTSGIVSALGRSGLGIEDYEDFIQTDASINPGNSGGALVNLRGELVGINTAIFAPSGGNIGIGFAIPSNMTRGIVTQLVSFGKVRRGLLGIAMQDLTQDLARAFGIDHTNGAIIVKTKEDSPADLAGLQPGDVIISINGERLRSAAEMHNRLGLLQVGQVVRIEAVRDGATLVLETTMVERQRDLVDSQSLHPRLVGAILADMDSEHPLFGRLEGIQVIEVARGTVAEDAGFLEGDVITAANKVRVQNLDELAHVLSRSGNSLILRIQRGNSAVFALIR